MTTKLGTVGCTIVARNYLPYARVVADGWRRHHDGLPFFVLVIDEDDDAARRDGLELVSSSDLGIPACELAQLRGIYGVVELSTALKPHLLRFLLDRGADAVVFLDSDTEIHADLHDCALIAARHGIALSPHFLAPSPLDGFSPMETEIGWCGIFNSGFLAVGQSGRSFLDWWASRLRWDCLFCEEMGMHADQRWLDFVPSYFEHNVLRDPGINVAHWNLHERPIRSDGGSFTVNGGPLRTFHFSSFDPERAEHPGSDGWPAPLRFEMSAEPDLRRLCREYGDRLLASGVLESRSIPYGYAKSASGRSLRTWERRVYREVLLAAEARGACEIPDPFDPAHSSEFERMLTKPEAMGLSDAALARLGDVRLADLSARDISRGPLRKAVGLSRQLVRRLPLQRHGWMPYPLAGARTRLEYASEGQYASDGPPPPTSSAKAA